jgi:hypothetical protein
MRFSLKELRALLIESFDLEELHSLCFDLDIDFDSLAGSTIDSKARELIAACQRHNRLPDLLAVCRQQRPHIAWPDLPGKSAVYPADTLSPIHTYLTGKIQDLQQQINIFYPLPAFPTHEAQLLLAAINIVQKADEQLFTKSDQFYHDVPAQLRSWATPMGLPQPPFTCLAFVDLAAASQIVAQIEQIRAEAATTVFILYTTPAEYEHCLQTLPPLLQTFQKGWPAVGNGCAPTLR